ncbi:hypothetical protein HMPREF1092_03281 [Clostridium thermobutyricum]|uniref:Uncharacterized protein n=1 Tax=Clostridium thermobutyricum TaxID=29372 RepID=N9XS19_9CLOT|nr:hypothetical protein [Clostridium thermobutyricum]ENY98723.1 hypothetical protein HMPREF1092_03281 [Clostridium thermobutyricum]
MKIIAEFNSIEEVKEFSKAFKANEIIMPPIQIDNEAINALVETKKSEDYEIKEETKAKTKKVSNKKEEEKVVKEDVKEEKKIDFTEIREVATTLVKAGKQPELAEITAKYGASKLSELKEEDYEAVLNEFKELM